MVWQIPHKDGVKKKKIYEDEYKIIWEDKQGNQSADLKQKRISGVQRCSRIV
ncbi:hypothetical protein LCGC14_1161170 [marine sediment metagenome]|uniref:Uncharacterized protein n=1 Tax=marine sediment metagenome TaxID=412755 RepID=A0A0F9PY80_9ZZZZ